jgi:N6-adenosine-specific RNA methylase IME4
MKRYAIFYADPPWDYKGQTQHNGKGGKSTGSAATHYPGVKTEVLKHLQVSTFAAEDALLFLWVSSPHLDQGIDLLKSWGFQYATVAFVWDKQVTNPGFYTLSQCELCLVGKRGKIPQPRGSRKERQYVPEHRGTHSTKPHEVRARIERMFPTQAKLELFARTASPGWDVWGNEVASDVTLLWPGGPSEMEATVAETQSV